MGSTSHSEYAAFEEKVRRTVYLDNLSPQVSESVLKNSLDQFGTVKNVQFIPNYMRSNDNSRYALVEMENSRQAKAIVSAMGEFPFMVSGMPRPVRARAAETEMFDDRPIRPGRRIKCMWVDPQDPDFEVAQSLKSLVQQHAAEASFLLKQQLAQEEKLAKQQGEALKTNYKKYELVDTITSDGTAKRLARLYGMNVSDD